MIRTSSSTWVRGLVEMFASQGVDTMALLKEAGVQPGRLEDADARFEPDEVSRLWELAVARSGNRDLGMDRALAARYTNFDMVGFATLSSADLRSALLEFSRYLALISSATTFELAPQGDDCWVVMGHTGYSRPLPPQRSSYSLLALLSLTQWVTRRDIQPLEVHLVFDAPGDPALYASAFGCAVQFGRADYRMLLARDDLAGALPGRNPALLALHEQVLEQRLASLGDDSMALRVCKEIMRRLQQGEPRREDVARSLALSDRTLQRRLQAEHTSFQQLVDRTRQELAAKYLADSRYALGEVAHQLGFADQSNFFRACKRWFGQAPGRYREQLAAGATG